MTAVEFYFVVEKTWFVDFDKFKNAMAKGGLPKTDFPYAVGCLPGYITNLRRNNRHDVKHSTIANKIIKALRADKPCAGCTASADAEKQWKKLYNTRHNLAERLERQVADEREYQASATASELEASASDRRENPPSDVAPTAALNASQDQSDSFVNSPGSWPGRQRNAVGELCDARADWRDTNLAPGEGQWLQLRLRFDKSYTRYRAGNIPLDVFLHRVHVHIKLDGGRANSRDPWFELAEADPHKLTIRQGNDWSENQPTFDIDNPARSTPLSGEYDWFDLCEVTSTVGDAALLELSASIGGISIPLPQEIVEKLDPDKRNDHDVEEERLVEGWLRHRVVPKSHLAAGGLYQLTVIDIGKRSK